MVELTFCSARNCKDFAYGRNLCRKHYARRYRMPRINGGACLADGSGSLEKDSLICIVAVQKEEQTSLVHELRLGKRQRHAHNTGQTLAQRVVQRST